jgi:hypothetical protein
MLHDPCISDRHLHRDLLVRVVVLDRKVLKAEAVDVGDGGVDFERRERPRRIGELLLERADVVRVHVRVAEEVHKLAGLQAAHLRERALDGTVVPLYPRRVALN